MQEIKRQVARARRRLTAQKFVTVLPWCMFAALIVAGVAIAIPKIWPIAWAGTTWTYAWLWGSLGAGVLLAVVWTLVARRRWLDAAMELDRRFGLKERVSSTLALGPEELATVPGQALVADAIKRVQNLDVRDAFHVRPSWHGALPLVMALLVVLVGFLFDDATQKAAQAANANTEALKKAIEDSAERLKKELAERKEEAKAKGLKDAEDIFEKLQRGLENVKEQNEGDYKKALLKINDLTKELEERRKELGAAGEMQKQLEQLKNLQQGPAEKMANALKKGDLEKAVEELKKMQEQLKNGEMSDAEKQQLKQQLDEMKSQLEKLNEDFNEAKKQLQEQIQQKKQAGDLAGASELQKQLDNLNAQNQQMDQLQQLAQQLSKSSEALSQNDMKAAAEALSEMADSLQDMQDQLAELDTIDEAMDQIASAKDAMCQACQGNQMGNMLSPNLSPGQMSNRQGMGMSDGRGQGDRPEEETATGGYDARERGKVQKGQAIRTGDAIGPNKSGLTLAEQQEQIEAAIKEDPEPIINQRLPRTEKQHANEYFEKVRTGG